MFLVELSYNTVKDEIKELDLKKNRKAFALKDSSDQLEKDSDKLIKFIETDNRTTSDRNKDAELATQERKAAEARIKAIDAKIQNVKSEIDKNVDQLSSLEDLKKFLFIIFKTDISHPKWADMQESKKTTLLEAIKRDWIERTKLQKDSLDDDQQLLTEFLKPHNQKTADTSAANKTGGASSNSPTKSNRKSQGGKGVANSTKEMEARFE